MIGTAGSFPGQMQGGVLKMWISIALLDLATVCRAMFDRPVLIRGMKIGNHQMISLQQCIVYESKDEQTD
ncbi:MAG: hypothetical protein CENE_01702 [Candidatus Celerinatantimonas neptuna]|nr:MAG: hypothetical protein CENE_01702 [Candidatus Celerinatantimonas neptuna]